MIGAASAYFLRGRLAPGIPVGIPVRRPGGRPDLQTIATQKTAAPGASEQDNALAGRSGGARHGASLRICGKRASSHNFESTAAGLWVQSRITCRPAPRRAGRKRATHGVSSVAAATRGPAPVPPGGER